MGKDTTKSSPKKSRPALSIEARQNQLIALATDAAEEQIRNGTASSQLLTHFLKLGTVKAQLELEKLKKENELLRAKTDAIESEQRKDEMYAKAIEAMRTYSGHGDADEY